MTQSVLVGYEVGTGEPVSIPLRHMAVTGQTQESGKTTTLEALVKRSGASALAFVTKRGEQSFAGVRRIQPYFRDRADWQFVTSILDATLQEKNKFLRPWIIKICRTTKTLADVQREIRKAHATAKGIHEGVYTQLDAYLDLIVPEIRRAELAPMLDLQDDLAVMDVSAFATPMQMLFVQSALDWINEHASNTVVVIPEAWEFIPEWKGSPVKQSAVTLVRKGAGLGNRIWADSQDMAGVDKTILRGCAVWLIGVQREANEIKRNLANIPASIKRPTAKAVAELTIGQFYVCWGTHAVKTYVQPAWMDAQTARGIATGDVPMIPLAPARTRTIQPTEATVNEREAEALRQDNQRLRDQIEELERAIAELRRPSPKAETPVSRAKPAASSNGGSSHASPIGFDEAGYQEIKRRLIEDLPSDTAVMRIVAARPELRVEVERKVINVDGDTLRGRMARLIAEGWFSKAKTTGDVISELERRGYDGGPTININVGKEMKALCEMGFFTRDNKWFSIVPEMVVNVVER